MTLQSRTRVRFIDVVPTYRKVKNEVEKHNSIAIVNVSSFVTHPINDAMR